MFFTSKMNYIQLMILIKDIEHILQHLGKSGVFQISKTYLKNDYEAFSQEDKITKEKKNLLDTLFMMQEKITDFLGYSTPKHSEQLCDYEEIEYFFENLFKKIFPLQKKIEEANERLKYYENNIEQIKEFERLSVKEMDLEKLNFIFYTTGSILKSDLDYVNERLDNQLIAKEIGDSVYILLCPKKKKWPLESELKKTSFKHKDFPFEKDIIASEIYRELIEKKKNIELDLKKLELEKQNIKIEYESNFYKYSSVLQLLKLFTSLSQGFNKSDKICLIEGWIETKNLHYFNEDLQETIGDTFSLKIYKPEDLEEVKSGEVSVPVIFNNPWFLKPFESIVKQFGSPDYGSFDPTLFVAISFLLLFGLMFGDMGQGLILFFIGLFLKFSRNDKLSKFKEISFIVQLSGISAIFFGYIYGSIFSFEHEQVGFILTPINKFLFNYPHPYLLNIFPSSIDNIATIVYLALSIGFILNLLGIVINIINNFIRKEISKAIFYRTGIFGFLFLLTIFLIFLDFIIFHTLNIRFLIYFLLICTVFMLLEEPMDNIIKKRQKILSHGIAFFILHILIELIEIILTTLSNNLSFIRVAAFAIVHTLLCYITTQIAAVAGYGGIFIILLGNTIIIVLEGVIVSIQTIRLENYEFFSKFFTIKGIPFKPFKLK